MTENQNHYDVIIIGAGAAGLMCAATAGGLGRRVLVLDASEKKAEKIRISGGGRCNFTNIHTSPANYLSQNPHFCKSALARYTPTDFLDLLERHGIAWHEKTLGQLFCDGKSEQIINMLWDECERGDVTIQQGTPVKNISYHDGVYGVDAEDGMYHAGALVIATGGLSIPKIGATDFGYRIARQFGHTVIEPRAGLVPLTFAPDILEKTKALAGVSVDAVVTCGKTSFREGLLFTHRGLSGPSVLQISSYWCEGQSLTINMAPDTDIEGYLTSLRENHPKMDIARALSEILPKRLVAMIGEDSSINQGNVADLSNDKITTLARAINAWHVTPIGTEGYKTAEVTLGGVDTNELSSKTMESRKQKGLYFIGEVVDVTGHLGGFNFQWAWASGVAAGQAV